MTPTANVTFTPAKLKCLKQQYEDAVEQGTDVFVFEGHELLVDYAKYLIQYLEGQFAGRDTPHEAGMCSCLQCMKKREALVHRRAIR